MEEEMIIFVAMGLMGLLFLLRTIYKACKDADEGIRYYYRTRNQMPSFSVKSTLANEEQPPSYEEAVRQANALAAKKRLRRRRRQRPDNVTSDVNKDRRANTGTQLDEESTGDSNIGDDGDENVNSGTHMDNDSGVNIHFGEDNVVNSRSRKSNKFDDADDSGVKSGSDDDIFDKDDASGKYDTVSSSNIEGGKEHHHLGLISG